MLPKSTANTANSPLLLCIQIQVPIPGTYISRLQTIHSAATKVIYGQEASVTTSETADNKFEGYMSVGKTIHRFNEIPLRSPASIQMLIIMYSLRYISNILGYKILDFNFPTLADLTSAINKCNADMNILHTIVLAMAEYIEQIYESFLCLQDHLSTISPHSANTAEISTRIDHFTQQLQTYRNNIKDLLQQFINSKVRHAPPSNKKYTNATILP